MQGNHKSKTYKDTHVYRKKGLETTPKIVIKYQEKRAKEKKNQKHYKNNNLKKSGSKYIPINNYFKYK